MNSKVLIQQIYLRVTRMKWLIILFAAGMAVAGYFFAKSKPVIYTARSTVFPNSGDAESSSDAGSRLSELLGSGRATKSLSSEATISLEEVALSRKTREATVAERLPQFGNKMIAELLIDNYNQTKAFYQPAVVKPAFDTMIIATGASILQQACTPPKVNKNSLLEIYLNLSDQRLLAPISYTFIDKISVFYRELRRRKAKEDFDFTQQKVDSLRGVMNSYDRRMIDMNKTSLFTPNNRLQYSLPKENLQTDKMRVLSQISSAAANREDALWRLQKVTPVVDILDRPEPPYPPKAASGLLYAFGGFVIGLLLILAALLAPLLYRYANSSIKQAVFSDTPTASENVTTSA